MDEARKRQDEEFILSVIDNVKKEIFARLPKCDDLVIICDHLDSAIEQTQSHYKECASVKKEDSKLKDTTIPPLYR
jgi:hypothetical protein